MLTACADVRERAASPSFSAELIVAHELARVREDWADLFDRSVECNVFYGPDLLEPLANSPLADESFQALLVWREAAGVRTLAGFMPLRWPTTPLAPVRGFKHHHIVGATPLLDARAPVEAARALLDGLASLRSGALLVLDDVRLDWPAWRALREAAAQSGRLAQEFDVVLRAGVSPHSDPRLARKTAQNLRRSGARLSRLGSWTVTMTDDPHEARAGLDALLAVEASGWKGRAGTALACTPDRLAFARAAFDPANQRPKPRFSVLSLAGKPIAVSMHLIGHDNSANLKCAYDEEYASCSPGILLDAAVAEDLKRTHFTPMIDSVALPGHPVERVWPERLRCGWTAIACYPGTSSAEFHARVSIESLQRTMRRLAVRIYKSARPVLGKAAGRD